MRRRPFRDVRSRLLLIVLGALAVALACATLVFDVLFTATTARNADAFLRARAESELALIRVADGRVSVAGRTADAAGDSRVWIFGRTGVVEAPPSAAATAAAARLLAGSSPRFVDVPQTDDRLYAVPITAGGRRAGTLVTGISMAPYESTRRSATIASGVLIAVALLMVGIAVWWLLRLALRPVERMTEQAAAWSEHDLDRRFGLGDPHDELTRLAATLDALLDRIAASLRHERRFSAEISHELRTPLARLTAEAELALRRERSPDEYRHSLDLIHRQAQQIGRIVETLVAAARRASSVEGVADAGAVARAVATNVGGLADSAAISVQIDGTPAVLRVGVDGEIAERILQPVVENAVRYGSGAVTIDVRRDRAGIVFAVEDDGPGVTADEAEEIFEPAVRGRAGREGPAGAGLGLALARRLARAASGDVEAVPHARGRFIVRMPAG